MPADPVSPRILAVANQKGGVGKTTTAINLGAALARAGQRILVLDLDPQGNASTGLGITPEQRHANSYDLLSEGADPTEAIRPTSQKNLWIIPATGALSSVDIDLAQTANRTTLLRGALRSDHLSRFAFDYILIDCPPSLNLLTVNALVAADAVLVPLQSEFFALEGLSQLMKTVRQVRETANPQLRIEGVVLTMYDKRNNLSLQVEADARANLGDIVCRTVIPRNIRLSEAPSYSLPVIEYDPTSTGSIAYLRLAEELMEKQGRRVANV